MTQNDTQSDILTYSNPRKRDIIENWPIGCGATGSAIFQIESNPKGTLERMTRTTEKRNGTFAKPKKATYGRKCRLVDGSDGKTYFIVLGEYGGISVMRGDMKYSQEYIGDTDERFADILAMFE